MSVGPPFRQSMAQNLPFVITLLIALAISSYMLFDPAPWLYDLMELTWMSVGFRVFVLVLGLGSFAVSYLCERLVFQRLAAVIGRLRVRLSGRRKKRKDYKVIAEAMRI